MDKVALPKKSSFENNWRSCCCCSVAQSCPTLCDPRDCSTPGFPVLQSSEFAQTQFRWVDDAIQPPSFCHPLLFLPSVFPSIGGFSSESALCIRWPKYWSSIYRIGGQSCMLKKWRSCAISKEVCNSWRGNQLTMALTLKQNHGSEWIMQPSFLDQNFSLCNSGQRYLSQCAFFSGYFLCLSGYIPISTYLPSKYPPK